MSSSSAAGGKRLVRKVSMDSKSKKQKLAMVPRYLRTRGTPNGVHQFKRVVSATFNVNNLGIQIPGGGSYQTDFAIRFGLQNCVFVGTGTTTVGVPGIAELTALFDQIRLDKVVVRIISQNDSSPILAGAQNFAVGVSTAIDYNSDQPITSTQLREYSSWKFNVIEPGGVAEHKRTLKPMYQRAITYTGGAGLNGVEAARGYIGSISGDISHYGLLGNIAGGNQISSVLIFVEHYFSCKNQK